MAVKTYDPASISIVLGSVLMSGFADGTFVKVTMNDDAWKLHVGADGQGSRAKSANRSATIEVTLAQTSPINNFLADLAAVDDATPGGAPSALFIKDFNGTTVLRAESAWVKKLPDVEFGKEVGDRVWTIETDRLVSFVGGN